MLELLVVDDEAAIQHAFRKAFRDQDITIRHADCAVEAVRQIGQHRPDVIVLDIHLPDATGLETLQRIRQIDARIPVILITGHGTSELAIEAMKEGAFDYLLKPLELAELRELIQRAMRSSQLMSKPAAISDIDPEPATGDILIGKCPAMQDVYKAIGRVARQEVTVLILGESGTGKELVARAIYQHSQRAERPFVAINCGAIPENLVESELFGHEKGAFTGADRKRIGKFEQARGGTIFLDEVGNLPMLAQMKMLRLIQEQQFERVNGEELVQTDVRLIAATNASLEKMVEAGTFRKDLFFRLNVFTISLPPLRERGDDLILLIDHFVRRYARELGKAVPSLPAETIACLQAYPWPGNVRELQSVIKQSLLQMRGNLLLIDDLPGTITGQVRQAVVEEQAIYGNFDWDEFVNSRIASGTEQLYAEGLEKMEREVLLRTLRHTEGNQLRAAKILGITRGSLRTKIRSLNININREVWSDDEQEGS